MVRGGGYERKKERSTGAHARAEADCPMWAWRMATTARGPSRPTAVIRVRWSVSLFLSFFSFDCHRREGGCCEVLRGNGCIHHHVHVSCIMFMYHPDTLYATTPPNFLYPMYLRAQSTVQLRSANVCPSSSFRSAQMRALSASRQLLSRRQ